MSPQTDTQSRTTTKQIQFIEVNSKFILVVERELAPFFCKESLGQASSLSFIS